MNDEREGLVYSVSIWSTPQLLDYNKALLDTIMILRKYVSLINPEYPCSPDISNLFLQINLIFPEVPRIPPVINSLFSLEKMKRCRTERRSM